METEEANIARSDIVPPDMNTINFIHPVFGEQYQIAGSGIYNADIGVDYGNDGDCNGLIINSNVDRLGNYGNNDKVNGIGSDYRRYNQSVYYRGHNEYGEYRGNNGWEL